jgi:hypothetical protein
MDLAADACNADGRPDAIEANLHQLGRLASSHVRLQKVKSRIK